MQQDSAYRAVDQPDGWLILATEEHAVAATLASSPYSAVGFFVGWVAVGVCLASHLIRRGHDRRTLLAIGVGLGPLLMLVMRSWQAQESAVGTDVVATGAPLGGSAHVLVVIVDGGAGVGTLRDNIDAVRPDLATVTVARTVAFEWLDGAENAELSAARSDVRHALETLELPGARGEIRPGTNAQMVADFRRAHADGIVLFALDQDRVDLPLPGAN